MPSFPSRSSPSCVCCRPNVSFCSLPSTWAFTFSWAAVATVALVWLEDVHGPGYRTWQYVVLAAITLLVGAIAARTLLALGRGQLLPRRRSRPSRPPKLSKCPVASEPQIGRARESEERVPARPAIPTPR